jgi:hypothetical protein
VKITLHNGYFEVLAADTDPFAPDEITRLSGLTSTHIRLRDEARRPRREYN